MLSNKVRHQSVNTANQKHVRAQLSEGFIASQESLPRGEFHELILHALRLLQRRLMFFNGHVHILAAMFRSSGPMAFA